MDRKKWIIEAIRKVREVALLLNLCFINSSTIPTQSHNLKRAILDRKQLCSPWAFEMYPNPVLFRHLSFAVPTIIDSRWRHIPMDLNHINREGKVISDGVTQQKRAAIDWEVTGRDGKHNTGTEDGSKKKDNHGMSGMGDEESDDDAGVVVKEPDLRSTPPDKDAFACSHCELKFSKLGKLK
jgi:hypothetical protein